MDEIDIRVPQESASQRLDLFLGGHCPDLSRSRIQALIRRASSATEPTTLTAGDLTLNLLTREVKRGERKIELTTREFALLDQLMRSPGRVFTRMQICEQVWSYNFDPGTNLLSVYMSYLRSAIDDGFDVKLIQTVRGRGFVIGAESNGKDAGSARKGGSSG